MQYKIKEISENVLSTCQEMLESFINGKRKDYISGNDWINNKYYIFIDCDQEPGGINYFWFSVEQADRDGYEDSVDEQDTSDVSENSILNNIKWLLDRNKEIFI